jgi:dinuclear metal center YbgI/SA1388 family protein
MTMISVATIVDDLDQFAPPRLAADWDNVGLLLGDRASPVQRLMTCLTVTTETAAEAIESGVGLVVTHHPILFRAVQRLTAATSEGRTLLGLIRAGVAVYSPHTAFDNTRGGINDMLARRLGLADVVPLKREEGPRQCKVVVFVPEADLGSVMAALFGAGAGDIGQYRECSFRLAGTGSFFGSDASNPTVGQKGRREEVAEWRLETICPEERVEAVVAAMRRAHSYEEPAFDVYPLRPASGPLGEGRVGRLLAKTPLGELARIVKAALHAAAVQTVGAADRPVERVAIVCGAGGSFVSDAVRARADVLVTGEARFHDCLAAQAQGLTLMLAGHYATERCGVEELADRLRQQWPELEIWASRRERDPLASV